MYLFYGSERSPRVSHTAVSELNTEQESQFDVAIGPKLPDDGEVGKEIAFFRKIF